MPTLENFIIEQLEKELNDELRINAELPVPDNGHPTIPPPPNYDIDFVLEMTR